MTIDELLDTNIPLPTSGPGFGEIRYCTSGDLASAIRAIERRCIDGEDHQAQAELVSILRTLHRSLRRQAARTGAMVVFDLPVFSIEAALGRHPKYGFKKGRV